MGNSCSTQEDEHDASFPNDTPEGLVPSEKALTAGGSSPTDEPPKPQIFAIMRNGHEVLRGSLRDCDEYLQKGDVMKFAQEFHSAMKWQGIHAKMEDGSAPYSGFFPILNAKFDNICKEKGLMDAHDDLEKLEHSVEQAIRSGQIASIRAAYAKFSEVNEKHYKDEEDVMMPKVKAMMEAKEPLKKMMSEQILPIAIADDFQFFVEFAMRTLEKHHENMPRARVFAHALSAVATTEQWRLWEIWVQRSVSPALFKEIKDLACPQEGGKKLATPAPTVQAPPIVEYAWAAPGVQTFAPAPFMVPPMMTSPVQTFTSTYAAPFTTMAAPINAPTYGAPLAASFRAPFVGPMATTGSMTAPVTTMGAPMTTLAAPTSTIGAPFVATGYRTPRMP